MSIKVIRRPNGIYHLRGTVPGCTKRIDRSSGTRDREQAQILAAKEEHRLFEIFSKGEATVTTFLEAAETHIRATFGRHQDHAYLKPLCAELGSMRMCDIYQDNLDAAALKIKPNVSGATRRRSVYTPFISVWTRAERSNKAPRRQFIRPPSGDARDVWLKPAEAEALLAELNPSMVALVTFCLGTGCRIGEALSLTWGSVSPAAQAVTLRATNTKAKRTRTIELGSRVRAAMPQRRGDADHVFLNTLGEPWVAHASINEALASACKRAKLSKHVSCHVLRHTFATWAYAQTRNLPLMMQQGGWATANVAMGYTHVATQDLAPLVEAHNWELLGTRLPNVQEKLKQVI